MECKYVCSHEVVFEVLLEQLQVFNWHAVERVRREYVFSLTRHRGRCLLDAVAMCLTSPSRTHRDRTEVTGKELIE